MTEYDFSDLSDFQVDFGSDPQLATINEPAIGVAVVDSDVAVRDYLASLFTDPMQAVTAREVEELSNGRPMVAVLGPSCVKPEEFAVLSTWPSQAPHLGSILVTTDASLELVQQAFRAGIHDVIPAPVDEALLAETVSRVANTLQPETPEIASPPPPESPIPSPPSPTPGQKLGRVISVFSTKGGSGKSITAANLAVLLAQSSPEPVVLIDGHLQFGDQEVMLKMRAEHTVVDAIEKIETVDSGFVRALLSVHEGSGLLLLAAPREPTFADQITGGQMQRLIKLCQEFAGHVIVDLPAIFNEVVISSLEQSQDIVYVAGLDLPNIKNVKIGLRTLEMLNIDRDSVHLVLNRADSKVKLDIGEVERTLGGPSPLHVPSDVVIPISVNKGSPVVLSAPKSGPARAFAELARRFDTNVPQVAASSSGRRRFFG